MAANTEPLLLLSEEPNVWILHFVVKVKCQSVFAKKIIGSFVLMILNTIQHFQQKKKNFPHLTMSHWDYQLKLKQNQTQQNIHTTVLHWLKKKG